MDQKVSYDNTGTVVNPLNFEMVIEYLNPQNETYYFAFVALSQKTATCALTVSAVNKTAAASRPSRKLKPIKMTNKRISQYCGFRLLQLTTFSFVGFN